MFTILNKCYLSSPRRESPRHALFLCLLQPNLISKLHDSLYILPLASLPSFPCLITFLWAASPLGVWGWAGGVILRVVNEVCMYVQISIYHMSKNRKPLACFLPFPHPFFAFAYPRKSAHCQNIRTIFLTLCLMFLLHLKEPELQMPMSWWKRKASWVCFIQSFPKGNKQAKYIHKNAWNALWGLLNDSNRGAEVLGFIHAGVGRLSKISSGVWNC